VSSNGQRTAFLILQWRITLVTAIGAVAHRLGVVDELWNGRSVSTLSPRSRGSWGFALMTFLIRTLAHLCGTDRFEA
jgi:hypothetical protein